MKKYLAILISALLLLSMAACGTGDVSSASSSLPEESSGSSSVESESSPEESSSPESEETESSESTQIPNPYVDCTSMEDAAETSGFTLELPEALTQKGEPVIQAIEGTLISVSYPDGKGEIIVRKGSGEEDVSGDFNVYEEQSTAEADGTEVTLRGNGGLVNLAIWQRDGFSYSLSFSEGIAADEIVGLIAGIR